MAKKLLMFSLNKKQRRFFALLHQQLIHAVLLGGTVTSEGQLTRLKQSSLKFTDTQIKHLGYLLLATHKSLNGERLDSESLVSDLESYFNSRSGKAWVFRKYPRVSFSADVHTINGRSVDMVKRKLDRYHKRFFLTRMVLRVFTRIKRWQRHYRYYQKIIQVRMALQAKRSVVVRDGDLETKVDHMPRKKAQTKAPSQSFDLLAAEILQISLGASEEVEGISKNSDLSSNVRADKIAALKVWFDKQMEGLADKLFSYMGSLPGTEIGALWEILKNQIHNFSKKINDMQGEIRKNDLYAIVPVSKVFRTEEYKINTAEVPPHFQYWLEDMEDLHTIFCAYRKEIMKAGTKVGKRNINDQAKQKIGLAYRKIIPPYHPDKFFKPKIKRNEKHNTIIEEFIFCPQSKRLAFNALTELKDACIEYLEKTVDDISQVFLDERGSHLSVAVDPIDEVMRRHYKLIAKVWSDTLGQESKSIYLSLSLIEQHNQEMAVRFKAEAEKAESGLPLIFQLTHLGSREDWLVYKQQRSAQLARSADTVERMVAKMELEYAEISANVFERTFVNYDKQEIAKKPDMQEYYNRRCDIFRRYFTLQVNFLVRREACTDYAGIKGVYQSLESAFRNIEKFHEALMESMERKFFYTESDVEKYACRINLSCINSYYAVFGDILKRNLYEFKQIESAYLTYRKFSDTHLVAKAVLQGGGISANDAMEVRSSPSTLYAELNQVTFKTIANLVNAFSAHVRRVRSTHSTEDDISILTAAHAKISCMLKHKLEETSKSYNNVAYLIYGFGLDTVDYLYSSACALVKASENQCRTPISGCSQTLFSHSGPSRAPSPNPAAMGLARADLCANSTTVHEGISLQESEIPRTYARGIVMSWRS